LKLPKQETETNQFLVKAEKLKSKQKSLNRLCHEENYPLSSRKLTGWKFGFSSRKNNFF
jgi:hypothetical protein